MGLVCDIFKRKKPRASKNAPLFPSPNYYATLVETTTWEAYGKGMPCFLIKNIWLNPNKFIGWTRGIRPQKARAKIPMIGLCLMLEKLPKETLAKVKLKWEILQKKYKSLYPSLGCINLGDNQSTLPSFNLPEFFTTNRPQFVKGVHSCLLEEN